jgi:hypothetical protein
MSNLHSSSRPESLRSFCVRFLTFESALVPALRALILIALGMFLTAGCAKVGEPQPPEVHVPKPAVDLVARQSSDSIVLRVSMPEQNTDGSPATTLRTLEVLRLVDEAKGQNRAPLPQDAFIKQAVRILSIPAARFPSYLHEKILVIQDKLTPLDSSVIYSSAFRYAVLFINKKNQTAGLSNQVLISPVPIPRAPAGLSAEVTEVSIKLKWTQPTENMDGSKPARIAGYNLYRSEEPNQFPSVPINSDPPQNTEFEDRKFQFDKTYYYAASVVGSLKEPYAESLASEAISVAARDVFPPDPPDNFNAVRENGTVVLLWTPPAAPDVAGYRLYRQEVGTTARQLFQDELITALSYRDKSASPDKAYEYGLKAVDTHGNESAAVTTTVESQ